MITNFNEYINEHIKSTSDGIFWGNIAGGVLPYCKNTGRILLSYRSKYVLEPNTWGVWGGKIDEEVGEVQGDIKDVVKREFLEETGYDDNIELIPLYIYKTKDNKFKYYNFLGILDDEFEPTLNWETESYDWLTLEELINLKNKHFGLIELLKQDLNKIKNIIKKPNL